jgi:UDP-N-acetylglucosamine--N-acetylmuramyl-(pentapeptide) pyrophosphoryl-undecaprenol N-acetylglucosamine transferase
VLVPYPHAAADHQQQNAQWAVAAGGCAWVSQQGPTERLAEVLAQTVAPLVADDARRRQMGLAMRSLARCDAADNVAAVIRRIAGSSQQPAVSNSLSGERG